MIRAVNALSSEEFSLVSKNGPSFRRWLGDHYRRNAPAEEGEKKKKTTPNVVIFSNSIPTKMKSKRAELMATFGLLSEALQVEVLRNPKTLAAFIKTGDVTKLDTLSARFETYDAFFFALQALEDLSIPVVRGGAYHFDVTVGMQLSEDLAIYSMPSLDIDGVLDNRCVYWAACMIQKVIVDEDREAVEYQYGSAFAQGIHTRGAQMMCPTADVMSAREMYERMGNNRIS